MSDNPRVLGNRYEVGDLLGRGGMAEVHLGRDTRLGRVVAIKLLRTDLARDPIFQARFRREAQSAAALNHPTIVAVYDTGEEHVMDSGGALVALPYIVMEYIEGRTLRELLFEGRPLQPALAVDLTLGVLAALEYSHRAGIVHRDIKPANVMLTPSGDVKVMDFGIARALADVSATMTQTQAVIGTAQYLSPEQARGETVDARSDLYSAGCLLFELVTGRPPFVADSPVAVAYQHVREAPPRPGELNPEVPEDLERVVLHSLAKDREHRYQSAAEFRADLENLRSGRPVAAPAAVLHQAVEPGQTAATEYLAYPTQAQTGGAGPPMTRPLTEPMSSSGSPARPDGGFGPLQVPVGGDTYAAGSGYTTGHPAAPYSEYDYPDGAQRRREPQRSGRNNVGFVLLGLVSVAVFAAVAYLVYSLLGTRGATEVTLPNVTGLALARAEADLAALGLETDVTTEPNEQRPENTVISQNPEQGTRVEEGSTVALVVSSGSANVQVPDLKGLSQQDARAELEKVGLSVGGTETVDSAEVEKDHVVETKPAALTNVPKGDEVTLVLSTGQVTVPNVVDKTIAEAKQILGDLGISVNSVEEQSDRPEGTVLSQDLSPDSKVDAGSATITLRVAIPLQQPEPSVEPPPDPQPEPTPGESPQSNG